MHPRMTQEPLSGCFVLVDIGVSSISYYVFLNTMY